MIIIDVIIGVNISGEVSFSNSFPAKVKSINLGQILADVSLSSLAGELASMITAKSVQRMGLTVGCEVTVMIKASQISLEAVNDN